jgi:hypothetical protein
MDELVRRDTRKFLDTAARPSNLEIDYGCRPDAEMKPTVIRR